MSIWFDSFRKQKQAESAALIEKVCVGCGAKFSTHDDRVRFCEKCYIVDEDGEEDA